MHDKLLWDKKEGDTAGSSFTSTVAPPVGDVALANCRGEDTLTKSDHTKNFGLTEAVETTIIACGMAYKIRSLFCDIMLILFVLSNYFNVE